MTSMRIFEIRHCKSGRGVRVQLYTIQSIGEMLYTIQVGETGRGRVLGVLKVKLLREPEIGTGEDVTIYYGKIDPKQRLLVETEAAEDNEHAIVVLKTPIGFRGSNDHLGDLKGYDEKGEPMFEEFPGRVIVSGIIAQGIAGRMGSGDQLIAIVPRGKVFTTRLYGRTYGEPKVCYHVFDGETILSVTHQERKLSDVFPPFQFTKSEKEW